VAQYKVLQDVEAEDKLLGPLTLRQFIYAVIVIVLGFVAFKLATVQWYLAIPFLPPVAFFAMLAAPFGRDQSSEVWLLAKIKYFIFPRRRIWSQDGIQNLVAITVPKVEAHEVTKDFDKVEATSRLKALAATMDTRGWAIKNVATPGYQNPLIQPGGSDRLLDLQSAPPDDEINVKPDEDILDTNNTPLAQTMGSMQAQNQQEHRQAILQKMQNLAAQQKTALNNMATLPVTPSTGSSVTPKTTPAAVKPTPVPGVAQPVTQKQPPAILKEVKSPPPPTELNVNTGSAGDGGEAEEVVVSLH